MKVAPDLVHAEDLARARGGRLGSPIELARETDSTNDDAKEGARRGAPHGAVWIAESQRRGRGRAGRRWESSAGENLLFSVLLRLTCPPSRLSLVSLAAGLAVRDVVADVLGDDEAVLVKWPNDVLVRRTGDGRLRKIAGVLVESAMVGARVDYVVVGIGLNVHARVLPPEIAELATSVALESDARGKSSSFDRGEILASVLARLDHDVEHVVARGLGIVHARLARRDAMLGEEVASEDGLICGVGAGIDADGRLRVRLADGTIVPVASGEVVWRKAVAT